MGLPTALLLQTFFFDGRLAKTFARLQRDCRAHFQPFVLIHLPPDMPKPAGLSDIAHHCVTTPEIRNPAYLRKSAGGAQWRIWAGGHSDLPLLHFAQAHPEFKYYWNIEYDVRVGGPWSYLFDAFEDNPADFLATSLRTAAADPDWPNWPTLQPPATEPIELSQEDQTCCFMPLFRASSAAVKAMDGAYREGWGGHCEATWPTILRRNGMLVEDIGGNGEFVRPANRGRFYTSTPKAWDLSPGTCVFKPARSGLFLRRGMIYHPVKPFVATCREKIWRARAKLASMVGRRQPSIPQLESPSRGALEPSGILDGPVSSRISESRVSADRAS
jgi:Protein of unknown function (DUF3405)